MTKKTLDELAEEGNLTLRDVIDDGFGGYISIRKQTKLGTYKVLMNYDQFLSFMLKNNVGCFYFPNGISLMQYIEDIEV